jgi:hypothetical protein
MTTPTAPQTTSLLVIRERHLKHQIDHRPAATYFQAPIQKIQDLERLQNLRLLRKSAQGGRAQ